MISEQRSMGKGMDAGRVKIAKKFKDIQ